MGRTVRPAIPLQNGDIQRDRGSPGFNSASFWPGQVPVASLHYMWMQQSGGGARGGFCQTLQGPTGGVTLQQRHTPGVTLPIPPCQRYPRQLRHPQLHPHAHRNCYRASHHLYTRVEARIKAMQPARAQGVLAPPGRAARTAVALICDGNTILGGSEAVGGKGGVAEDMARHVPLQPLPPAQRPARLPLLCTTLGSTSIVV